MTASVIPLSPRRVPRRLGPVPVVLAASQVLGGVTGPLLELRLKVRLNDIPLGQRRALAGLLRSGDRLALTLATGRGGEGGSGGWGGE
jgi:hypothetical protein